MSSEKDNVLPDREGSGYESTIHDLASCAEAMSKAIDHEDIIAMIRVVRNTDNFMTHVDNCVTYRGLQTIIGEGRTLWLPDRFVDINNLECDYDENGTMYANSLQVTEDDIENFLQVDKDHMTLHKGVEFPNPFYHAPACNLPKMGTKSGVRVIVTFDPIF